MDLPGRVRPIHAESKPMPDSTETAVTLINILTVEPHNQQKLVALLKENTESVVKTLHGWLSTDLVASADGRHVAIYSRWHAPADLEDMRTDPRMLAYFPRIAELASLTSIAGRNVMSNYHS